MPQFLPEPTEEGIVAIGGPITAEMLQQSYANGIFPWPHEGYPLLWFAPDPRAILDFDALHVGDRLARRRRNSTYTFTINNCFRTVMEACATVPRADQDGTWITSAMLKAYTDLHALGDAHSIEVWDGEMLVAGLYGVYVAGVFSGESMFTRVTDGSKLAVLYLIDHLRSLGLTWLDIEQLTPHFEALGAVEISRVDFMARLRDAAAKPHIPFV